MSIFSTCSSKCKWGDDRVSASSVFPQISIEPSWRATSSSCRVSSDKTGSATLKYLSFVPWKKVCKETGRMNFEVFAERLWCSLWCRLMRLVLAYSVSQSSKVQLKPEMMGKAAKGGESLEGHNTCSGSSNLSFEMLSINCCLSVRYILCLSKWLSIAFFWMPYWHSRQMRTWYRALYSRRSFGPSLMLFAADGRNVWHIASVLFGDEVTGVCQRQNYTTREVFVSVGEIAKIRISGPKRALEQHMRFLYAVLLNKTSWLQLPYVVPDAHQRC